MVFTKFFGNSGKFVCRMTLTIQLSGVVFGGASLSAEPNPPDSELTPNLEEIRGFFQNQKRNKTDYFATATIAVFGGFNSCFYGPNATDVYTNLVRLLEEREANGQYYRIVASCFGRSNSKVSYFTSTDPESIRSGKPDDVVAAVKSESAKIKSNSVYVIGHSYGGWLSLKTARDLPDAVTIKGLTSIDPISTKYCTPYTFTQAYFSSVFSFNPEPGCTEAPRDITQVDRSRIHNRSGWWYNFYQDNSSFLHSGIIAGAKNFYVKYDISSIFGIITAHASIDGDERVWNQFRHLILE